MTQASPGKIERLHRTPAGSTALAFDGTGLCDQWPARPAKDASYPVSVRQVAALLHTSFRRHLAMTPLCFASPSPPSGWTGDFHPQAIEHAGHTTGSLTRPQRFVPPKGGSPPDVELFQPLILLLLVADVRPYRLLIPTDRVDEVPPGPEVLSHEVALPFPVNPGEMDRALTLDEPDHLRHRVLRWDRDQHMHMIGHQVPFLDLRLLLRGRLVEHLAEMPAQLQIQSLPSTLRNEDDVVFALPRGVA